MTTIAATGFAIVLLAGLLQGLFALPMKFARGWNYENIWLIFATTGLVIFPWMLTAATVPHLPSVYRAPPTPVLLSSSLNFCYAFVGAAMDQARALVGSPLCSSNVITAFGDDRWVLCQSCLLRLSASQELDGWPLLVGPSAQELDLRRSHGSLLVRRLGSLWPGGFARWRFWNDTRLAAVDGHDHHQQSCWLFHLRTGGNRGDE